MLALLLSLALHAWLLFFVRFVQPSWKSFASGALPLHVILEKMHTEAVKPTEIFQASQDSKGEAKVGVQDENLFLLKPVTAVANDLVDQPRTKIPKIFTSKKILTIARPAKEKMDENVPELLVTELPVPEKQEKPFASTPSVETHVAKVAPPVEELVGLEPSRGEKQEKIVFAESAQEKPTDTKSGGSVEEPPVKVEEPKPVKIEEPQPVKIEEPKPVKIEEPKPIKIEEPKPVKVEEPKPVKIEESKPMKIEEQKPAKLETVAEPEARHSEGGGKYEALRAEPPDYKTPGLAELSIAAVRRISREDDKKITFGERRKAVGSGEKEFHYAAYMEGVRLKLERIGAFNYPAAAAMNNLTGTLSVKISIRSDGSLENFSIVRPSVYEVLNNGAEKIVRMSAPFSPLPDNIKRDADILDITINWAFSGSKQSINY